MYRDDTCAVCGASLPPDHIYCREHAAGVDDRLHRLAALAPEVRDAARQLVALLDGTAGETWDYLAESDPRDPEWPPSAAVTLRVDPEEIDVDVDSEPGYVRVRLDVPVARLLAAAVDALGALDPVFLDACAAADGAGATH